MCIRYPAGAGAGAGSSGGDGGDAVRASLEYLCMYFHRSAATLSDEFRQKARRQNYVTPTSFLELLSQFSSSLGIKQTEVGALLGFQYPVTARRFSVARHRHRYRDGG